MEWKTSQHEKFDIEKYVAWRAFMLDAESRYKPQPKSPRMDHNGFHQSSNIQSGLQHINTKAKYWL